jgi:uncharacterized iron-regulated protein
MRHLAAILGRCCGVVLSAGLMSAGVIAQCVPAAAWVVPGDPGKTPLTTKEIVARAAARNIVLLGEQHDSADHHRWQLQILAALHAARPDMVVGFEMFPRRVQGVLDRWIAGELTETQFLAQADWRNVWQMDAALYLPLFHWARINRVPMIALNVERALIREVAEKGFDAVPVDRREGVSRPSEAADDYTKWLLGVFREHRRPGSQSVTAADPGFRRFVESQQVWDRAMAEALAAAHQRQRKPLAVGILGSGHVVRGFGVPQQLQALGVGEVISLLPWDAAADCNDLVKGYADAVYGIPASPSETRPQRARLGVVLERATGGVLIKQVDAGSIAATAGIRSGDLAIEIAGVKLEAVGDIADAVQRQAPGTWLPIKIVRNGETMELVAKFPPAPK